MFKYFDKYLLLKQMLNGKAEKHTVEQKDYDFLIVQRTLCAMNHIIHHLVDSPDTHGY